MNLHLRDLFLCLDENTLLYIKHSNDMKSLVLAVNEIFCWFIVINTFKDVTIMFTGKNCQTCMPVAAAAWIYRINFHSQCLIIYIFI